MQETVGRITSLEQRIGKMDMELKDYFVEMRAFTSEALASVEARLGVRINRVEERLGARIDRVETRLGGLGAKIASLETRVGGLEARLERFQRDVKIGFQVVDGRLGRVERQLDHIDLKLDTLIRRLPRPARSPGSKGSRRRKTSR